MDLNVRELSMSTELSHLRAAEAVRDFAAAVRSRESEVLFYRLTDAAKARLLSDVRARSLVHGATDDAMTAAHCVMRIGYLMLPFHWPVIALGP